MNRTINEYGKPFWSGATDESAFDAENFHMVDMGNHNDENDEQWALHTNLGSLTVLDRMTGFGWRDVETGYRDQNGNFWLASGNYDVRYSGAKNLGDAIKWVKDRANNCVGETTRVAK